MSSDYDSPFEGMSEDEFLYRAMNEDDEMYMGDEDDEEEDDYSSIYEENNEEEDDAYTSMIEEMESTLEFAWDDDETTCIGDDLWCVENVKIISTVGDKYTVTYDLCPLSDEEKLQLVTLTADLKKESDDTFTIINLGY